MQNKFGKILVLMFSVTAVSCYVWNASQPKKEEDSKSREPVSAPHAQQSTVSDEDVKAARESMLRSSKSGRIMSEEDTRAMLEEQLEQRKKTTPKADDLAPSSKVMRIVGPDKLKEITREEADEWLNQKNNNALKANDLAPSSKVMRIVSPDEVKEVQQKLQPKPQPASEEPAQQSTR